MRLIDAEPLKELFPDNGEGSWTYNATAKAYIDAQPEQQNARIFQGVIVEYPTNSTYPEYEGKPYFSIKYTEDGQDFIGYGTYKPDVLSEYLKKYFIPFAQPETNCSEIPNNSDTISRQVAIDAVGNMLRRKFGIGGDLAEITLAGLPSAQPERKTGRWIESNPRDSKVCRLMTCSECGKAYIVNINVPYEDWTEAHKFCVECGTKMEGGDE